MNSCDRSEIQKTLATKLFTTTLLNVPQDGVFLVDDILCNLEISG